MVVYIKDPVIIREFVTHPAIWDMVSDDFSDINKYVPILRDDLYYLSEPGVALFAYEMKGRILAEVHSMVLPERRGASGRRAAQDSLRWMFENTETLKVMTHVPKYNNAALVFSIRNGLTLEGINRKSFKKNNELHDQYLLGITKDEFICQLRQSEPSPEV